MDNVSKEEFRVTQHVMETIKDEMPTIVQSMVSMMVMVMVMVVVMVIVMVMVMVMVMVLVLVVVLMLISMIDACENQIIPSQLSLGVEVDADELSLRWRTNKNEPCNK